MNTYSTCHTHIYTHKQDIRLDGWILSLSLTCLSFLLVSFMDCSGGKVWFEVGAPSDFRVSERGVVYTMRHLSLVGKGKAVVMVYARDLLSKQEWKTRVHLHMGPQQVTL